MEFCDVSQYINYYTLVLITSGIDLYASLVSLLNSWNERLYSAIAKLSFKSKHLFIVHKGIWELKNS